MAKINASKKIIVEDFPSESRTLMQRLAQVLNPFLDQVTAALTGNLTLAHNLKSKVWVLDLPADVSRYTVAWGLNEKPTEVRLGNLRKQADGSAPAAAVLLSWVYKDATIELTLVGLPAATRHIVTIVGQV